MCLASVRRAVKNSTMAVEISRIDCNSCNTSPLPLILQRRLFSTLIKRPVGLDLPRRTCNARKLDNDSNLNSGVTNYSNRLSACFQGSAPTPTPQGPIVVHTIESNTAYVGVIAKARLKSKAIVDRSISGCYLVFASTGSNLQVPPVCCTATIQWADNY